MITTILLIIAGIVSGLVVGYVIFSKKNSNIEVKTSPNWEDLKVSLNSEWESKVSNLTLEHNKIITELNQKFKDDEKTIRQDAIDRSKAVLNGKMWEQIFPFTKDFEYNPSDARFVGAPVDFIIFDGASEDNIQQVIFYEIKTGKSKLNKQENNLKKAIQNKNVIWKTVNVTLPEIVA